jgi:hypothetical protein
MNAMGKNETKMGGKWGKVSKNEMHVTHTHE